MDSKHNLSPDNLQDSSFKKYDNANEVIYEYIVNSGVNNPVILDIGCSAGSLGRQLKRKIKCRVDGIDIDPDALENAEARGYRNTYVMNLDNPDFSVLNDDYDFVVFGDVLEHIVNPEDILTAVREKLSSDGRIAVSLPNVGFLYYRLSHLLGYWEHTETGVMDKTHLHFYTLSSMRKLFAKQQLSICKMDGYVGLRNRLAIIRQPLKFLARLWPSLFAIQIVFLLKNSE